MMCAAASSICTACIQQWREGWEWWCYSVAGFNVQGWTSLKHWCCSADDGPAMDGVPLPLWKPSQAGQGSQSFWVRFESQELKPCSLLPPCILLMTALPEIAVVLIAMTCSSSMISLPSNVFFGVCRRCRDQNYGRIFTCVRACINLRATNPSMWYILCGSTVFLIIIISASTCVCHCCQPQRFSQE
jgi:hypothetical protein